MKHKCRYCAKLLTDVLLDLGYQPLSNALILPEQVDEPEAYYPLKVYTCDCGLAQIPEYKSAAGIFNEAYPYYSSQSPANVSHAAKLVDCIMKRFNPRSVLELGSNDGYLLQHFPSHVNKLGIEPAAGPSLVARTEKNIRTITEFFTTQNVRKLDLENRYDVVCSINVLAHQSDLHDFVEGIKLTLKPEGVTIHEFPHLERLIKGVQFDTIYHEHYNYYSFTFICQLLKAHGLEVFDVEEIPEHGGSLRVFAQGLMSGNRLVSPTVAQLLESEQKWGFSSTTAKKFQKEVNAIRNVLPDTLTTIHKMGAAIVAYGAAAKGNTLLNSCHIENDLVQFAVDRSPYKQGCLLPGSRIPIKSEKDLIALRPDYVLILPWNLKEEIMKQLAYVKQWGGKFIIPIPGVKII